MSTRATLNEEQKNAFKAIQKFIEHPSADTFVLKGYAGTGKTFLMQYLANWLSENEHKFCMLASTGRAATVLRGKTGFQARTVHSELYRFNKVDGADDNIPIDAPIDNYRQMTLQFLLRKPDERKQVYIVDEASMLSSDLAIDMSFAKFGSGYLLTDFFHAAGSNKIIFVGDPCQLPPIGESLSPALDMDWLSKEHRIAVALTLEKIERVNPENDILVLANSIRNLSLQTCREKYPKLPACNLNNVVIHSSEKALFRHYFESYQQVGTNGAIAISRTNYRVQQINRAFRRDLYNGLDKPLQCGDILLVVHNNYKLPLANGDFAEVVNLGEVRLQSNLHFQNIKVKALLSGTEFELLVSLDILYGNFGNFTREQSKALMVDFNRRMRKKNVKPNSEKYKTAMMEDDFLNCLRCTYGYAVTCHKAQGGEWENVFLFLDDGMYAMDRSELFRWWYTAVTRAKRQLHLSGGWWLK